MLTFTLLSQVTGGAWLGATALWNGAAWGVPALQEHVPDVTEADAEEAKAIIKALRVTGEMTLPDLPSNGVRWAVAQAFPGGVSLCQRDCVVTVRV